MSTCNLCLGDRVVYDGRVARRCDCADPAKSRSALARHLASAGLSPKEIESAISPWDTSVDTHSLRQVLAVARRWASGSLDYPTTIVLVGGFGTGKTKIAAMGLAEYLREGGRGARWLSMATAPEEADFERRRGSRGTETRALTPGLAIYDEVGGAGKWYEEIEARWIYERHRQGWPTILTTNHKSTEDLGGRLASRINDALTLTAGTSDYRAKRKGAIQ